MRNYAVILEYSLNATRNDFVSREAVDDCFLLCA